MTTNVPCQRCGGPTKYKQFVSKRGTNTVIFECISGCVDDRGYALGTFPPRNPPQGQSYSAPYRGPQSQPPMQYPAARPPVSNQPAAAPNNAQMQVLLRIEIQLKNVLVCLQKLSGHVPVQPEELQPDDHFEPPLPPEGSAF